MKKLLFILLISASSAFAQSWSGIIPAGTGIDWSAAGIPGGIPSSAWTQIGTTLPGGSTMTAIQNALNACGTNHSVLLGAGTFTITGTVSIPSNCALRGSGASQTILNVTGTANPIAIGNGSVTYSPTAISAGATAGSSTITVGSNSGMSIGGYLVIAETNDGTTVSIQGGEGNCNWCDSGFSSTGLYSSGQIVEITGISGTSITISPGLYRAYTNSPFAVPFTASVKFAGVENLQIYNNNTNHNQEISMTKAAYCWIKGVEVNYTHLMIK